jgi:hypothetical protein
MMRRISLPVAAVMVGGVLAACGGTAQLAPSAAVQPSLLGVPSLVGGAALAGRTRSWVDPAAKSGALLYISDAKEAEVFIYSYPGRELQGELMGFTTPLGECLDKAGDVFIADGGSSKIYEFPHGGFTPIATLSDAGYEPSDCSVDPKTGDLAVTNFNNGTVAGNIALYRHARGLPKAYYTDPDMAYPIACGYDDAGNLYLDGYAAPDDKKYRFAEMPTGKTTFTNIKLNQPITAGVGVLWDGKDVDVQDEATETIYHFTIEGNKGEEVASTPLIDSDKIAFFWIDKPRVVAADFMNSPSDVGFWAWPSGGPVRKTISGFEKAVGVTISPAVK